jgi:hypothetical protein
MKQRLWRLALVTSPILAVYGVLPVYIFYPTPLPRILGAVVALCVVFFLYWGLNIYLLAWVKKSFARYAWSYFFANIIHILLFVPAPKPVDDDNLVGFVAYPIISVLAVNTIILIIIRAIVLQAEKEAAEHEIKNLKFNNLEAQKQVLLQQLQPHFLFNALSTLKSLIRENPKAGEDYVVRLSEFLRYSVQAHAGDLVGLAEELQFTQAYLELQKARFGEALECQIDLPPLVLGHRLPSYALQTLVENAIKHNHFTEKKPLRIRIESEDDRLRVSNNRQPKQLTSPSGTGLANLDKRYQLTAERAIEIVKTENEFVVFIPLIAP